MNILVAGDNPNHLGGHADHNPFRLFVKARFRELLRAYPDAGLHLPLQLGPGQWCAEVAVEVGRPFVAGEVPSAPSRWYERQVKHYEELLAASGCTERWNCDGGHVLPADFRAIPDIYLLACLGDGHELSLAGKAVRIVSTIEAAVIERLTPSGMPVSYRFLGAMEDMRDLLPEPEKLAAAIVKLDGVLNESWGSMEARERADGRYKQVLMLYQIVRALKERK